MALPDAGGIGGGLGVAKEGDLDQEQPPTGSPRRLKVVSHFAAAQVNLPDSPGNAVVWVLFLAALAGMWMLLRRTQRRAEQTRRERLRHQQEWMNRPEPEDPSEL